MTTSRFALLALFVSSLPLFGCGNSSASTTGSASAQAASLSVHDQCAALDKANEAWSDKITKRKDTKDSAKDNQAMAKDLDAWSAAVGKLPIDDATLKKLQTDEQGALKDQSKAINDLTVLMAKVDSPKTAADPKAMDDMQKQMDGIEKKVDAVQAAADAIDRKIDTYCSDK